MNIEQNIIEVPIEQIIPNRFQPRLTFEDKGLEELSKSIKEHGIIQPLVLRRVEDKYEIVAGERRYKAATMAGLTKVPAIIADIDDNKSAEVAIVENVQRRDLSAIEEARSYKSLLDKGYLTQTELAKKMGLSQSAIANKLRLLSLDEAVQDALLNNKISERHARSLLVLPNAEEQKRWLDKIINERLTVRQLDSELKKVTNATIDDEDDTDIPLVKSLDIDTIREQATELPKVGEESEIARKLREIEQEKMYNPDVIPVDQATNKSKGNFFNFLEEEVVNMNTEETKITAPNTFPTFKEDNSSKELNSIPKTPSLPSEFVKTNNDDDFDPANLIETLDPNYQPKEEQVQNSNLINVINDIRNIKNKLSNEGYNITLEESDLSDTYEFIIKIKKS